ncbi:type IV toxin-antitoxin system YeeU family antitoxin [Aeromonas salmonicida]|uniref:type IV toxin-antitoxin system YeeU family antitoxin n=1 Tax=Aeromonas salmonicida TaxID=645 RepID=UPI0013153664|nr:type IV toxin-antitoxin system YeeU family antitoxin [Aeromonas salmonicida]
MSIIASWGLQTPVLPRFGARAIVDRGSVNLLWDRSVVYGEADEQWLAEIDVVLPYFIEQLSALFQPTFRT